MGARGVVTEAHGGLKAGEMMGRDLWSEESVKREKSLSRNTFFHSKPVPLGPCILFQPPNLQIISAPPESQSHRMVEVEGDLWRSPAPSQATQSRLLWTLSPTTDMDLISISSPKMSLLSPRFPKTPSPHVFSAVIGKVEFGFPRDNRKYLWKDKSEI